MKIQKPFIIFFVFFLILPYFTHALTMDELVKKSLQHTGKVLGANTGVTYYISPSGNDTNSGTTVQTPLATFIHAQSLLNAGDTLLVRGGTYNDQFMQLSPGASTANSPITVKAYPGETPVLTGNPTYNLFFNIGTSAIIDGISFVNVASTTADDINITASYVTIQNCIFDGAPGNIIRLYDADHITVQNNSFKNNGTIDTDGEGDAIAVDGSQYNLIQNNYFSHNGHAAVDVLDDTNNGISAYNIIKNNTIDQYWGGGIYIIRLSHDNVVEGNTIKHVGLGLLYPKDDIQIAANNNIVRNNILTLTAGNKVDEVIGLFGYQYSKYNQDSKNDRIYNNDIYNNQYESFLITQKNSSQITNNKILNNILYNNRTDGPGMLYIPNGDYEFQVETYHADSNNKWTGYPNNNYIQNNIIMPANDPGNDASLFYYDQEGWSKSMAQVQHGYPSFISNNIEQNPLFVNADGGDFNLTASSPAIDAGAHFAKTTSSGTNTISVQVDDPYYFTDGYGIDTGDFIKVGSNLPVQVTSVNYSSNTITVSTAISFNNADYVDLPYSGTGPDIGVYEFKSPTDTTPPVLSLISSSGISQSAVTITWTTDENSDTQVDYGLDINYGSSSSLNSSLTTSHSLSISSVRYPFLKTLSMRIF